MTEDNIYTIRVALDVKPVERSLGDVQEGCRRAAGAVEDAMQTMGRAMTKAFGEQNVRRVVDVWARLRSVVDGLRDSVEAVKLGMVNAFTGALEMVSPALRSLCARLTTAMNYISMFFAFLSGKSTYTRVSSGSNAIAQAAGDAQTLAVSLDEAKAAAEGTAEGVRKTAKAAKDAVRNLSGLDELNIWKTKKASGGGGGHGGGGAGGGEDDGGPFVEEVPLGDVPEFMVRLRDIVFDWSDINPEQMAEKILTAVCAATGGILGYTLGGGLGGVVGFILGGVLGVKLSELTFDGDGTLSKTEIEKLILGAIGGILGGVLGFFIGGVPGAAVGFLIGAALTLKIADITLGGDGDKSVREMLQQAFQTSVAGWVVGKLKVGVKLVKEGWTTLKKWVGDKVQAAVSLVKDGWSTLGKWIGTAGTALGAAIRLIKDGWTTLGKWVGTTSILGAAIRLVKSGWTTLKKWIGATAIYGCAVKLIRSGWTSLSKWVGTKVSVGVRLFKSGWSSLKSWIGSTVSVGVSLFKSGWYSLRSWLGLATGGLYQNGRWEPIQGYASGGKPRTGRLFVANENGMPELVGRLGSGTAVMNNGQIVASVADGVYRAVAAAMSQLGRWFAAMTNALGRLPGALSELRLPEEMVTVRPELQSVWNMPVHYPMPAMASGTVVPPKATYSEPRESGLPQLAEDLRELKSLLCGLVSGRNEQPVVVNVSLEGKVNQKTLFDAVKTEARVQRRSTGRDPFAG